MNESIKKALLVFTGGIALFLLFKPKSMSVKKLLNGAAIPEDDPKKRTPLKEPKVNPADIKGNKAAQSAFTALKAYVAAYNAGETQEKLSELNTEIGKEYGLTVYRRGLDKKVVVANLSGKIILEHNG